MKSTASRSRRRTVAVTAALALVAGAAAGGASVLDGSDGMRVTAWFDRAVGVYEGSDLRVLGVRVGRVEAVEPHGRKVEVTLRIDDGVKVPANARAVVIAPSLVSDRYVQLTPAYTEGPRLAADAILPSGRNSVPLEVDQLYASITELSDALGPEGANADGALSELLDVGAANLDGNGAAIGESVEQFGKAAKTLDGSSSDLFATVSYLRSFTSMLKRNDSRVRTAERRLGDITTFLAEDKENLAAALTQLATALGKVKKFIADNRGDLKKNVDKLAPVTQTLVEQRASLAEALDAAPLAADNVLKAYNPGHGTLDNRANINELSMGGPLLPATGPAASGTAGLVPVGPRARKTLPAVPLPPAGTVYGTPDDGRAAKNGKGDKGAGG
ncbi:MCE family protein [Streptomyces albus]|uniref:MCE family protein n=1 Tax=Streptomyces TaxID=1883 RepID=UPI0004C736C1|nr:MULTISPECIES: MCE family protein [Streptomyces]KPC95050.1 ABC transporter substrate-binding protein [Streptomyces sp. NRRL F-6602]QID39175.1 MCE family protein [Streptomyces albus]